jgi:dipeptidyl aminopeptidase/acylaminoacyl peptidase
MSRPISRSAILGSALAVAALASPAFAQQAQLRSFTIEDALEIRTTRIDDVSRDGRWTAFSVRIRRDQLGVNNERYGDPSYVTPTPGEFELVEANGGAPRHIVPGKVQVRGATFTKDGSKLAFFLMKGDNWALDIYDVAKSTVREVALHTTKQVASNSPLVWAPDGNSVIVSLRPDGWAAKARAAFLHMTQGDIVVQDAREPFLSWDAVRNMSDEQVPAVVTLTDGAVRELLPEADMRGVQFSADGSYIVYSTQVPKKTSYDNTSGTEFGVFRLKLAAGSKVDTLLKPSERRIMPRWNETATAFAYADRGNIFVRSLDADSAHNITAKFTRPASRADSTRTSYALVAWRPDGSALLVSAKDGYHLLDTHGDSVPLVYRFQGDSATRPTLNFASWSHDGRYLFMTRSAKDHWARGIERYDLTTRQPTQLVSDANLYSAWHVAEDGSRFVFERSDGDRPNEIYTAGKDFADTRQLTTTNTQLAGVALSHSELVSYRDVDGKKLYGVLYYPDHYEAGKKYPLATEMYETYFDNGYIEQMNLFAGREYFVLHPSVDLEIGYPGEAWVKGVTSAINSLEDRGLVDESKLGIFGTSYGGYAVNLLITQTNRFAAAINISGKVDIISFLGDSPKIGTRNYNAAEKGQDRIGQTLWEAPMKYIQHSAVMFADRIKTPLLMLTGKQDWNVPSTNEREMYYALRRLGKEAVWVEYGAAGHGAGRNGTETEFKDHWTRMFDWFGTHFEKSAKKDAASGGSR